MKKLKSALDIYLEFSDKLLNKSESKIYLETFIDMIEAAQINAVEITVENCAEEAVTRWNGDYTELPVNTIVVDKSSILNVAEKMKDMIK